MSKITAERFITLKEAVKNECARRNQIGGENGSISVASYSEAEYDYANLPATDARIRTEHYEKIAVPLNAINSETFPNTDGDRLVSEDELFSMEATTSQLSGTPKDSNTSDCSGGCTGLCYGNCRVDCGSGCSGGCKGSCKSGCWDICTSCTATCKGDCKGTCTGGCNSTCTGCSGTCSGSCNDVCTDGCTASCRAGCGNTTEWEMQ